MDDIRRFFLTGEPTNEVGVSDQDEWRAKDPRLRTVGDRMATAKGSAIEISLSMAWRMGRPRWAVGVGSSGVPGEDRFRVGLSPLSEFCGDCATGRDALGLEWVGESAVEISRITECVATFSASFKTPIMKPRTGGVRWVTQIKNADPLRHIGNEA